MITLDTLGILSYRSQEFQLPIAGLNTDNIRNACHDNLMYIRPSGPNKLDILLA
jgi:hypothetical protein